jgi:Transposase C of IS166 homeodomain
VRRTARESDSILRVSENANQLPTDVAALHALVAALCTERDAAIAQCDVAIAERDQMLAQNHRLEHLLQQLRRMQFGRRSEKLDADQLALAFEDVAIGAAGGYGRHAIDGLGLAMETAAPAIIAEEPGAKTADRSR